MPDEIDVELDKPEAGADVKPEKAESSSTSMSTELFKRAMDVKPEEEASASVTAVTKPAGQGAESAAAKAKNEMVPYERFQEINSKYRETEERLKHMQTEYEKAQTYLAQHLGVQKDRSGPTPIYQHPDPYRQPAEYAKWIEATLQPALARDPVGTIQQLSAPLVQEAIQSLMAQIDQRFNGKDLESKAQSWNRENKEFINSMSAEEKQWLDKSLRLMNPPETQLIEAAEMLKQVVVDKRKAVKVSSAEAQKKDLFGQALETPERGSLKEGSALPVYDPKKYSTSEEFVRAMAHALEGKGAI